MKAIANKNIIRKSGTNIKKGTMVIVKDKNLVINSKVMPEVLTDITLPNGEKFHTTKRIADKYFIRNDTRFIIPQSTVYQLMVCDQMSVG